MASRCSAPAGGKGGHGSAAPASVARFGRPAAFPGSSGLAHPCAARTAASRADPRWPRALQAGFVFPRCAVNEQSA